MIRFACLRLFPTSIATTAWCLSAIACLCLAVGFALPTRTFAASSGPVAAYSFDEGTGTTVEDVTGDGHAATIHGAKWSTHGRYGGAMEFDASEEGYLSVPSSPELDLNEEFTLEAWVRPGSGNAKYAPLVVKTTPGSQVQPYFLYEGSWEPDLPYGGLEGETEAETQSHAKEQIPDDAWTHLALVFDGSRTRIYVNGELVDEAAGSLTRTSEGELLIGADGYGDFFTGRMDEVRIYDRTLTTAEVVSDSETPIRTPKQGPVAAYSFDEGTGTTVEDVTGDGHAATIHGAKWSTHGRYGGAMEFDASEEGYLSVPSSPELDLNEEFTLEAWVRPGSGNAKYAPLVVKTTPGSQVQPYFLYEGSWEPDLPYGGLEGETEAETQSHAKEQIPDDAWTHLALVFDGSRTRIYVNGELVDEAAGSLTRTSEGELLIGADGYGDFFTGRMDEVRIYDRTLTTAEVVSDSETPIRTPKQGPVAAYSFDEGTGTTVEDVTGDGHAATIEDGDWGPGRYGGGIEFDGGGGQKCVSVADSPDLRLTEEFTLEAWVRPLGGAYEDPVVVREAGGQDAFGLGLGSRVESAPEGFIGQGKGSEAAVGGETRTNEWTSVATTYDGSKIRVYEEGELVAEEVAPTSPVTGEGPLKIGCDGPDGQFTGGIDEVRVYNRALTGSEVAVTAETPLETAKASPVAAYSFDEGEGETVEDVSGGGHTATIDGADWTIRGRYGGAMEFDAAEEDVLKIPGSPELDFNEEFTLEAWVRPSGEDNHSAPLIDKQEGSGHGYFLYEGGAVADRPVGAASEEQEYVHAENPLPAHAWSHVALVFTGGRTYLYVDGELVDNGAAEPVVTAEGELEIGGSTDTGDYFDGRIDEVRIYNRSLNAVEVGADMEAPLQAGKSGPIAEYSFDEGEGATVEDLTGNGHTATIEGAEWTPHGRYGGAMEFDGEGAALSIPASSELDLTEEFTLAAWIHPEEIREFDSIFSKENAGEPSFAYLIGDHHRQLASYFGGSTKDSVYSPGEEIEPHTWTHVAVTYDGAGAHVYLNGELVKSGPVPCIPITNGELRIGGSLFLGSKNDFKGRIDEVRIWNRALPPSEVRQSMSPPPAVITEPASEAQANEAVLHGWVTPKGENTDYFFQYGPTTAYGGEIAISEELEESAGEGEVEVSEAVIDLEPETTYHYRLVAVSPGGMSRGSDQTLTTGTRTMSPEEEDELRLADETETLLTSESSFAAPLATGGLNDFYGVQWSGNYDQSDSPETLDDVQELGAGLFRYVVFKPFDPLIEKNEKAEEENKKIKEENKKTGEKKPLKELEDEKTSPNVFTKTIARAAARGVTTLPYIGSGAFPTKSHWAEWKEFAHKLVQHYGPGSGFQQPIRAWEIWNEPNMPQEKAAGYEENVNPGLFGEFFAEMSAAIRNAAPNGENSVEILSPGLYGYKTSVKCGKEPKEYVHPRNPLCHETPDDFLDAMGHEGAYDAISLHPYVFRVGKQKQKLTAKNVRGAEKEVRRKISRVREGRRGKPIWITELGFPLEYANSASSKNEHAKFPPIGPDLQAQLTRAIFGMLYNHRSQLNIHHAIFYNIADPPNGEGWAGSCGLLTRTGVKRSAFKAYKKLLNE